VLATALQTGHGRRLVLAIGAAPLLLVPPAYLPEPAGYLLAQARRDEAQELASGLGFEGNFYGFAVPAPAGALLIALIPRSARAGATLSSETIQKEGARP
jgi:hypothetical protein